MEKGKQDMLDSRPRAQTSQLDFLESRSKCNFISL